MRLLKILGLLAILMVVLPRFQTAGPLSNAARSRSVRSFPDKPAEDEFRPAITSVRAECSRLRRARAA